jgi:hypothetical protein
MTTENKKETMDQIIYSATDMILSQLKEHKMDLEQAVVLCGGELSVSIGLRAMIGETGCVLASKVSFVKEKVTDEKKWLISSQEKLDFGQDEVDQVAEPTVRDIRGGKGE